MNMDLKAVKLAKLMYESTPEYETIVLKDKTDLSGILDKLPFLGNVYVVQESEMYHLLNGRTTYYVCRGHM